MENKNNYDLTFLLKKEEDLSSLSSLLDKIDFSEVKIESPVKMNLAYPIKNTEVAFMVVVKIESDADKLIALEKELRVMPEVIRYLLLREEDKKPKKSSGKKEMKKDKASDFSKSKSVSKSDSGLLTNKAIEEKIEEIMN